MVARKLIGGLTSRAFSAARHPIGTASYGVGVAQGVVKVGVTLARSLVEQGRGAATTAASEAVTDPVPMPEPTPAPSPGPQPTPTPESGPTTPPMPGPEPQPSPTSSAVADRAVDAGEDVTGAEAAEESLAAMETEPQSASRQGAHGGPDPEEQLANWGDELTDDVEVETPVGTTGAGEGYNPDTGETDLQQPGTEPLMDPSLTKSVKSEAETLRKAAEPEKD